MALPAFLVPEQVVHKNGQSEPLAIGDSSGAPLQLTLGITRIIEQQSLDVTVWGSSDGAAWGARPILTFQQKFYTGASGMLLDLTAHPGVSHLQARWKVHRWGHGVPVPMFGFYLFVESAPLTDG